MQWLTMFKKEMLESSRNYKWIWVPVSLILLGIMDPITTHFMPIILDSVGNLPEGAVIEIPTPPPAEVMMMSIGQYNLIGTLIIVLTTMSLISGELKSGVAELVLVKPVKYTNYVTAKWSANLVLLWASYLLGMISSWYYINLLFGDLSFSHVIVGSMFYGIWLTFVVTVTIFVSTLFKFPGLVGFISIILVIVMTVLTNVLSHILEWSPALISSYVYNVFLSGEISKNLIGAVIISVVLITILLYGSVKSLSTREL